MRAFRYATEVAPPIRMTLEKAESMISVERTTWSISHADFGICLRDGPLTRDGAVLLVDYCALAVCAGSSSALRQLASGLYSCMALPRDSVFFAEVLLIDNAILVHDKRHDAGGAVFGFLRN
jgi:hypothetical protein